MNYHEAEARSAWPKAFAVVAALLIFAGCEGWSQYQRTLRERARIDAGEPRQEPLWWESTRDR